MRHSYFFACAALLVACGGTTPSPTAPTAMPSTPAAPTASDTKDGALKEPGDAKVGDKSRCPVSGEEFTITASSPHADYQGKTYYFCCPGCDKRFQENPGKYTSAKAN